MGTRIGSGFAEADLRYTWQDSDNNNVMNDGGIFALRYGMPIGAYTAELAVGYASLGHENDVAGGSRALSNTLSLSAQIGYMAGSTEHGGDADDILNRATHIGFGVDYQASDRLTLGGDIFVGGGEADGDDDNYEFYELVFDADYNLGVPGLSANGQIVFGEHYQYVEHDRGRELRVGLGLTYEFGGNASRGRSSRMVLPRYENWLNMSGGLLE